MKYYPGTDIMSLSTANVRIRINRKNVLRLAKPRLVTSIIPIKNCTDIIYSRGLQLTYIYINIYTNTSTSESDTVFS